jgi:hypothetical protein
VRTSLSAKTIGSSSSKTIKVITEYLDIPSKLVRTNERIKNHALVTYFSSNSSKKILGESLDLLIFLHGGDKGTPENMSDVVFQSQRFDSVHAQRILKRLYDQGKISDNLVLVAPRMRMGSGNFTNQSLENWGDFVAITIPQFMRLRYGCTGRVSITGICEGGMSAAKLAIWYPNTFTFLGSMSGFFTDSFIADEYFFNLKNLTKVYLGIGLQDYFLNNNQRFYQILKEKEINVILDATQGSHPDFALWKYQFEQQILQFFGK